MAGAQSLETEQAELDARVDQILESRGGDWRAVIEMLLAALDYRAEQIAFGFAKGVLRR